MDLSDEDWNSLAFKMGTKNWLKKKVKSLKQESESPGLIAGAPLATAEKSVKLTLN